MSDLSYIQDGRMQGTVITTKIGEEVQLGAVIEENLRLRDCLNQLAKSIAVGQWADPQLQIEMLTIIKRALRSA